MHAILTGPERPTAVICGNDQLVFGAVIEVSVLGFSVPDDLSIAGFNDLEFATHSHPLLAIVKIAR
jgi:LacI family transcriptional regulator